MAQKRNIVIQTPKGQIYVTKGGTAKLKWNDGFGPDKTTGFNKAQEFIDSECIRRMNSYTPRLTGAMIKSATLGTVIGSGEIEYVSPYARRQYYEHKSKSQWFETMKKASLDGIRKGAAKFIAN